MWRAALLIESHPITWHSITTSFDLGETLELVRRQSWTQNEDGGFGLSAQCCAGQKLFSAPYVRIFNGGLHSRQGALGSFPRLPNQAALEFTGRNLCY